MQRIILCSLILLTTSANATELSKEHIKTRQALHKAVKFYQEQVSIEGGFLWRYTPDLKIREGEGRASRTTAWVQPSGTPTVGLALLEAYQRTKSEPLLRAAIRSANSLVKGQLQSGGWYYSIEYDKEKRKRYAYRSDGNRQGRNVTTLDDNTTQSALRFLMRLDRELKFKNKAIHQCVTYALSSLAKAQYPNGAWPQRYSKFPNPNDYPVKRASYPKTWPRTFPKKSYRGFYTFNDNAIADVIATFFEASDIYGKKEYKQVAEKAGGFILLAQMPEPQPAWAQQYDINMHPAWARRFEPPGVTGGESHGVMQTLILLYRRTGKKKYLKPIPKALAYLKKSELKGGKLARFYELKTNRPLFFTKKYELTYSSADMPTHYGFIVNSRLDRIERLLKRVQKRGPDLLQPQLHTIQLERPSAALKRNAMKIVAAMDKRGAWVEQGRLKYQGKRKIPDRMISSRTFARNITVLSRFLLSDIQN